MPRDPRVEKLQRLRTERLTRAAGGYSNTRATAYGNVQAGPRRGRDAGRTLLSLVLFVVIVAIALVSIGQYALHGYHPQVAQGRPKTVTITVKQGESTSDVAAQLEAQGLIPNATLFRLYENMSGNTILPGAHTLHTGMTQADIATALGQGPPPVPVVTLQLRDGWRAEQIAEALDKAGVTPYKQFMNEVTKGAFPYSFLQDRPPGASLEGYLMPDTYQFAKGSSAHAVIDKILQNFRVRVSAQDIQAGAKLYGSFYKAMIVASIVQREAGTDHDRGLIAGVYLNRLQDKSGQFKFLNADPTVQYAVGKPGNWWPAPLTDAQVHHNQAATAPRYNTYVYPNLPPGPIANPIAATIHATVNPTLSQYFYFHHVNGSHGASIFCTVQQGAQCVGPPQ